MGTLKKIKNIWKKEEGDKGRISATIFILFILFVVIVYPMWSISKELKIHNCLQKSSFIERDITDYYNRIASKYNLNLSDKEKYELVQKDYPGVEFRWCEDISRFNPDYSFTAPKPIKEERPKFYNYDQRSNLFWVKFFRLFLYDEKKHKYPNQQELVNEELKFNSQLCKIDPNRQLASKLEVIEAYPNGYDTTCKQLLME